MQNRSPVAYFSKVLSGRNALKSNYEKELMALVLAVLHWRLYLIGRCFTIRTDHHSLKHLLQQAIVSPAQQYWMAKLIGFDFVIEYKFRVSNVAADALSRRDLELECGAVSIPCWVDWDSLRSEARADPVYWPTIRALESGQPVSRPFVLANGVLYFKNRLAIPSNPRGYSGLSQSSIRPPREDMQVLIELILVWPRMCIGQV